MHTTTEMELEDNILYEISQSLKDKYYTVSLLQGIQNNQTYRDRKQNGGSQDLEGEGNGESCLMSIAFQFEKFKNVVEMESGRWLHNSVYVLTATKLYI